MTDAPFHHIAEQLQPLAVRVSDLTLDPANARRHPTRNLEAIKASLRFYGQRKPLVVRREGLVVEAGNGTLEAAKLLDARRSAEAVRGLLDEGLALVEPKDEQDDEAAVAG